MIKQHADRYDDISPKYINAPSHSINYLEWKTRGLNQPSRNFEILLLNREANPGLSRLPTNYSGSNLSLPRYSKTWKKRCLLDVPKLI